jgi:predicted TIM-barrel fold metal-dependent hydrolase
VNNFLSGVSRRNFLGGLAALGAGSLVQNGRMAAQGARPRLINVHHHLTAPAYAKFLTDNKVRDFPNKSGAQGIEEMDKAGINLAFTSIIGPGIWFGDLAATRRLARECNDYAAKLIADYPGRFGMFTMLPLPDIDGSLKEIEYGFETLKADGVYMFTNWGGKSLYGDKYLGDPALAPIYEELQRRRAIVYTHPKDPACCHDSLPGVNGATIEYPMDTTRTILSLLSSGTAAKYPDVRFIFSHAGGATTGVVGRIAGGATTFLQDGGTVRSGGPELGARLSLLQKFYYDTAGAANPVTLGALKKMVPLSQIFFGNDFPFGAAGEQHKLLVESGAFNAQELRAIDFENIGRLLPRARA